MTKAAIVYWSGTGNTEEMAHAVVTGAKRADVDVTIYTAAEFHEDMMDTYDSIAFGCPAMGAEELEDSEFGPMFEACESKLKGKKIGLFGSYDWGDGEWMRTWEEQCNALGAILVAEPVICNLSPDENAKTACQELGKALA